MEPSVLRKHVRDAIESGRHAAANRRAVNEAASRTWHTALETVVVPAWRQTVQVLKAEGYLLQVSTPSGAVRVSLEKTPQDGVELTLDTTGPEPSLLQRVTRSRGRDTTSDERIVVSGTEAIGALADEQACGLLLSAMAPFFER